LNTTRLRTRCLTVTVVNVGIVVVGARRIGLLETTRSRRSATKRLGSRATMEAVYKRQYLIFYCHGWKEKRLANNYQKPFLKICLPERACATRAGVVVPAVSWVVKGAAMRSLVPLPKLRLSRDNRVVPVSVLCENIIWGKTTQEKRVFYLDTWPCAEPCVKS